MKLDTWELESAARDRDTGKIIEIFASEFPELGDARAEWSLEIDNTKTLPNIVIAVVTPQIAVTYVKGAFRVIPSHIAKYMRLSDKPYCITLDGV
jgi:hypothetical protein